MHTTEKDNSIVNNNTYDRKRRLNSRWLADTLADLGVVCSCWTRCVTSLVSGTLCIGSPQSTGSLSAPVAPGCREEGFICPRFSRRVAGRGRDFTLWQTSQDAVSPHREIWAGGSILCLCGLGDGLTESNEEQERET